MHRQNFVRLPLRGAYNVRDLGGIPLADGSVTRWHTFLRADSMAELPDSDKIFLKNYGIDTVIDLRTPGENLTKPNAFVSEPQVAYRNISLAPGELGDVRTAEFSPGTGSGNSYLEKFYRDIFEKKCEEIKEVFSAIKQSRKAVLYHCTAGKDRTGVISLLLLDLVGASGPDIVSNYETSYTFMKNSPATVKMLSETGDSVSALFFSRSEYMETTYEYIHREHGGAQSYLLNAGVPKSDLEEIRERFTVKIK